MISDPGLPRPTMPTVKPSALILLLATSLALSACVVGPYRDDRGYRDDRDYGESGGYHQGGDFNPHRNGPHVPGTRDYGRRVWQE